MPRWAEESVATIRKQVDQLRLEERVEDVALVDRVREQITLRDRELAELKPAERATPRVDKPRANICSLPAGIPTTTIDGRLDDPAWKQATVLENFQPLMYFVRDRVAVKTTCRAMWDKQFLYLAFECVEPRIAELKSLPDEERRRNRTTLVLSTSAESRSFANRHPSGGSGEIPRPQIRPGMDGRGCREIPIAGKSSHDQHRLDSRMANRVGRARWHTRIWTNQTRHRHACP